MLFVPCSELSEAIFHYEEFYQSKLWLVIGHRSVTDPFLYQDELDKSIDSGTWRTQPHNEAILGGSLTQSVIMGCLNVLPDAPVRRPSFQNIT